MNRRAQKFSAALNFAAAAVCFGVGLAGKTGFWPAAVVSLALLTAGFYLAGAGPGRE